MRKAGTRNREKSSGGKELHYASPSRNSLAAARYPLPKQTFWGRQSKGAKDVEKTSVQRQKQEKYVLSRAEGIMKVRRKEIVHENALSFSET